MISSVLTGDVRQTLEQFQRSVDQMFQNFYGLPSETGRATPSGTGTEWRFSPAVESAWTDTSLTLRVILPGVTQNDVKVSVQNNQLILEGERKAPESRLRLPSERCEPHDWSRYHELTGASSPVRWEAKSGLLPGRSRGPRHCCGRRRWQDRECQLR